MLPAKRAMVLASRSSKRARACSSARRRRSASILRLSAELRLRSSVMRGANEAVRSSVPAEGCAALRRPLCRAPAVSGTRAPVAQLDRAPDYESGGQRFESFRARHFPFRVEPMRSLPFVALLAVTACTSAGGPYPSLRPRAAEAIDPRVEPARPVNDRPVAPALAAQLGALVAQARDGDAAFRPAAAQAE